MVRSGTPGVCFEIGLAEFTNRLCVGCEGKRGIKDGVKILWSDQWEE